jgi:hypothetical protein
MKHLLHDYWFGATVEARRRKSLFSGRIFVP